VSSYDLVKKNETTHEKIVATCYCHRRPIFYIMNIFFSYFLITSTSFNIFTFPCKSHSIRISSVFGLLATTVLMKVCIHNSLPLVAYLTIVDLYITFCFAFLCLEIIWFSIAGSFWSETDAFYADKLAFIIFASFFIFVHFCFITDMLSSYFKIRKLKKQEREFIRDIKIVKN
jgi:hypothetical protein